MRDEPDAGIDGSIRRLVLLVPAGKRCDHDTRVDYG
jgi:hypothetical protein